jgi:carboxyl-terminal processing protease
LNARIGVCTIALGGIALCGGLFGLPVFAQAMLSPAISSDVEQSYRLLETSSYRQVDPYVILAGGVAGLGAISHHHHVRIALPDLRGLPEPVALSRLENTIVQVAQRIRVTPEEAAYAAMAGMADAVGDRWTQFLTPDDVKKFDDALDPEKLPAIGILPGFGNAYVQVAYVIPDSPADRAGLQVDDALVTIDGRTTKGASPDSVTAMLRGAPGTPVHLTVSRDGGSPFVLDIVRAQVAPPTVVYRMLPGHVGYVAVFAFGRETPAQFDTALERVRKAGARALVLDLRNDGGGYVDSALEISAHFIADKALVTVEERGARDTTVQSDPGPVVGLPMMVLVNENTASASEITAGALQDDGVGTLVGTKTYGKGVMQTLTALPDGAAIKITTAHYLTPSNHDINLRGIEPDVRIDENRNAHLGDAARDVQLRAALDLLERKIAAADPDRR